MDQELKLFLEIDGLKSNLSIKGLTKYILKYILYGLILIIYYFITLISKARRDVMSVAYNVLKPCRRCVYGKRRETLLIISARGYSRDGNVLQVMNYNLNNYSNMGKCLGYLNCHECLDTIDKEPASKPCNFVKA